MKRAGIILSLVLLMTVFSAEGAAGDGRLSDIVSDGNGHYTCSFDGAERGFIVDLPQKTEGSPLVLMLHGYGNSAESFRRDTGFHEDANARGYTVVYVNGAPAPQDRTSAAGWNYEGDDQGNPDREFLEVLADHIEEQYLTDDGRCYAVGFSNGAFMCHRLALEASGTFSAVVSVAGIMPETVWERRPESSSTGVFQITGEKDDVVPKNSDGTAKYAKAPAIEDVIDYYVRANGLEESGTGTLGKGSVLTKYSGAETESQVWHLVVKDGRHSWPAENVNGIDTNRLILDYLDTQ